MTVSDSSENSFTKLTRELILSMRDMSKNDPIQASIVYGISTEEAKLIATFSMDDMLRAASKLNVFMFRPRVPISELIYGDDELVKSSILESVRY
jgi:hypothetical protein